MRLIVSEAESRMYLSYDETCFEEVFGVNLDSAKAFIERVNAFMLQIYGGIQTSVDCGEGLEAAKKEIQKVRLLSQ